MVIPESQNKKRVTLSLEPEDVELLDLLASFEGSNRSIVVRSLLDQVRPMLRDVISAFQRAQEARESLDKAAAQRALAEMEKLAQEAAEIGERARETMRAAVTAPAPDPRAVIRGSATPTPHLRRVPDEVPNSGRGER